MLRLFALLFFFLCYSDTYSVDIIRDSEVEAIVKDLAQPLFSAAGIDSDRIKIFIVNDRSINAFVINNNSVFINLGLLQYSTEPYTLLGILAHEIAHISADHVLRMTDAVVRFQSIAVASYMIGLVSSIVINPQFVTAILLSGATFSSRLFFNYSREQESVADRYALRYLDESGYSNSGMKDVFSYFKSIDYENTEEYFRTHPLSDKRIFAVKNYKVKNNIRSILLSKLLKFERMVAKLDSFFTSIHVLSHKYEGSSKYVNTIIRYRKGNIEEAINGVNELIEESRSDPYLYELKAEMLYKAGNLSEAIKVYEESLRYSSEENNCLVKLALSHTLLLQGEIKKAIFYLEQVVKVERNNAFVWKYLSIAYKLSGDMIMYNFALKEKASIEGNLEKFMQYPLSRCY